jgi:plasmid stabilization system protein ParE
MSFKLIVRREAQIDLDEIFVWYEERKIGLGFEFLEEFDNLVNKILDNPYFASVILEDARAATPKRFPYDVVYRIDIMQKEIRIIAVSHPPKPQTWLV